MKNAIALTIVFCRLLICLIAALIAIGLAPAHPVHAAPPRDVPAAEAPIGDMIISGNEHTCSFTSSGGVKCWGEIAVYNLATAMYSPTQMLL